MLQLEKQLGVELFTRSTRRISLTRAGKQLYDNFKPVSAAYEQAKQRTLKQLAPKRPPLRIAFFQALPKAQVVTQVVSYLLSRQPSLNLKMDAARLDDSISLLMEDAIDLCITNKHDFDSWEGVEFITLARMPAQIVVSLNHPWVMKKQITAEDMANAPVLLLEKRIELPADSFYKNIQAQRPSTPPISPPCWPSLTLPSTTPCSQSCSKMPTITSCVFSICRRACVLCTRWCACSRPKTRLPPCFMI